MKLAEIFGDWFGSSKKPYCSFRGKHHSAVAKLIAGRGCSICNECVLICSSVLLKECEPYRKSQIDKVRELLAGGSEPPHLPATKDLAEKADAGPPRDRPAS